MILLKRSPAGLMIGGTVDGALVAMPKKAMEPARAMCTFTATNVTLANCQQAPDFLTPS